MGPIEKEFLDTEMFSKLRHRSHTMAKMVGHIELAYTKGLNSVIETGTAWYPNGWSEHGQSTLIWDWVADRLPLLDVDSIDINPQAAEYASKLTKNVSFHTVDSVKKLNLMNFNAESCSLLFLDSYDWTPETAFESSFHHLAELASVWARLPWGCMIAVDDRHSSQQGKHLLVQGFMRKLGISPVFAEYQIGWIK